MPFIQNREALSTVLKTSIALSTFSFDTQLKIADSSASIQKALKTISIPHISLYQNSLDLIDEDSYEKIHDEMEQQPFNGVEDDEEDKKGWKKVVLPMFLFLYQMFFSWATSDTPVSDMQIIQQFEKVVEVIEDYQYPLETTDIELINEEDM
jgi:hypothetical protein